MDEANVEAAKSTLENEGDKEAEDDPAGFDDALENAGFFFDSESLKVIFQNQSEVRTVMRGDFHDKSFTR